MLRRFFIALQFLTQIPVPRMQDISDEEIGGSLAYYPLVGILIGSILALLAWLTSDIHHQLQAVLVLVVWVLITGGLHLDGLADSADAWLGGHGDRDKTLAIMKDPACGPAGVIALILVSLIKFVSLGIVLQHSDWLMLILIPVIARLLLILLFQTTDYVRQGGLGSALALHHSSLAGSSLLVIFALLVVLCAGYQGLSLMITGLVVFFILRRIMLGRIGGTTGDTAGAMLEIGEAMLLLVAAI